VGARYKRNSATKEKEESTNMESLGKNIPVSLPPTAEFVRTKNVSMLLGEGPLTSVYLPEGFFPGGGSTEAWRGDS